MRNTTHHLPVPRITNLAQHSTLVNQQRALLFQNALCVLYTPDREHFGIVPLEAMYAGAPVIAVASGGPLETVIDCKTGYLCENTPESFADAVEKLVADPELACSMGNAGHEHVKGKFNLDQFAVSFRQLLNGCIVAAQARRGCRFNAWVFLPLLFLFLSIIMSYYLD